jgi:hypothetical protein
LAGKVILVARADFENGNCKGDFLEGYGFSPLPAFTNSVPDLARLRGLLSIMGKNIAG